MRGAWRRCRGRGKPFVSGIVRPGARSCLGIGLVPLGTTRARDGQNHRRAIARPCVYSSRMSPGHVGNVLPLTKGCA